MVRTERSVGNVQRAKKKWLGTAPPFLELVDGETLQARIERGPLPVDEALTIAKQIAEALEAAHDMGITYRDRKPGNIMIRSDGSVRFWISDWLSGFLSSLKINELGPSQSRPLLEFLSA